MVTPINQMSDQKSGTKGRPALPLIILTFVLLVAAIWLLSTTYLKQREARQSLTWPSVEGIVIDHQLEKHTNREKSGYSESHVTHYVPVISYKYEVNGKNYTNKRITLENTEFETAKKANVYLAKYPIGMRMTVFYNPANPERAIVERTIPNPTVSYWLVGGTLCFSLVTLLAILFAVRKAYLAKGQQGAWKHTAFWKELRLG